MAAYDGAQFGDGIEGRAVLKSFSQYCFPFVGMPSTYGLSALKRQVRTPERPV
jgi:hypothetical protein